MNDTEFIRGISLWQPWAFWVMIGVKKIETRLHTRFKGLIGEDIFIHSAWKTNYKTGDTWPYLRDIRDYPFYGEAMKTRGAILGIIHVNEFRPLKGLRDAIDSKIECDSVQRYGLILSNPRPLQTPIPWKGQQGIMKAPRSLFPEVLFAIAKNSA